MIESSLRDDPSSKAAAIKETVYKADVENCSLLGDVTGNSMRGNVGGDGGRTSLNNALVESKEQAADLGTTHILIVTLKKASDITFNDTVAALATNVKPQLGGSEINAKAYKCN